MTAATLPSLAEIHQAAGDSDFFADTLKRLGGRESPDGARFMREVERAYNAAKTQPLDYVEQQILTFEKRHFKTDGHKEAAIRDEFGFSATRYYQRLNWLLDKPEALATQPLLVGRLRRQRATRQAAREGRIPTGGAR